MKKILFVLVLLFFCTPMVSAGEKFKLGGKLSDIYVSIKDAGKKYEGNMYIYQRIDGQYVYCIDPFTLINTKTVYDEYTKNNSIFNLSDEKLNKMNLISYYGYKYKDHTDIKWYAVTQFLIWKTIGVKEINFTNSSFKKVNTYDSEINEIENLVNNHYKLPSFYNSHLEYTVNSSYELNDSNNILSNYEIKSTNIDAKIVGNKLNINTKDKGNYEITFIRKSPINTNYILYASTGDQSLLFPGKINDIEFKITVEVDSGDVIVNKFDSENQNREFATLKGAVYGIYQNNELITTIETNEDGIAYFNDLEYGKYYIKEISPSEGYELDTNTYEFEINREKKDIVINSYENVIKGNIILNKYYGDNNNYKKENGAIFEIYDVFNNLIGRYETIDGVIDIELEYGKYYVIQIKGKSDYTYVDKFEINVDRKKKYVFDLYDEKEVLVVNVPDTYKTDYQRLISPMFLLSGIILIISVIRKNIKL